LLSLRLENGEKREKERERKRDNSEDASVERRVETLVPISNLHEEQDEDGKTTPISLARRG